MSEPAKASTYFHGGSSGFFVPVLAKIISCFERQPLVGPELLVELPDALGVDDADLSLSGRRQRGNVLLRVHIEPADEDAVDRFEVRQAGGPPLRPAPDGVAGRAILVLAEKISVTLSVTPAAAQFLQSAAGRPAWREP